MPELLLELFSEDIPARMQPRACRDLERLMAARLEEARLAFTEIKAYATPRRLALVVEGLPERQPDLTEEKRGPRTDAPEKAIEGFKRSLPAGAKIEEREEKKGTFLYGVIARKGRPTSEVLDDCINAVLNEFPWPKSMRWGENRFMRWVRPLQSILAIFGEDKFGGGWSFLSPDGHGESLAYTDKTRGHRFLAPDPVAVRDFADYKAKLKKAKVILDPAARRGRIFEKAKKLAREAGLELVEDAAMIAENAGLTEWPYPLLGRFDPAFLDVPEEALISAMRNHQKYLTLRDPKTGRLAPAFICVANTHADDGGAAITAGNERVLSARLSDARFFWEQDLKRPLEERVEDLKEIVFHEKLGTLAERVDRIEALAAHIAETVDFSHLPPHPPAALRRAPPSPQGGEGKTGAASTPSPLGGEGRGEGDDLAALVRRAAKLSKADLTTELVGEFPELQGTAGKYIALEQGEDEAVANAIATHYAPKGPDDACPRDPVSICVALAEKIDTLVGFFAFGEKPTGSKDPYALRRAALGVIRLIVENRLKFPLVLMFSYALIILTDQIRKKLMLLHEKTSQKIRTSEELVEIAKNLSDSTKGHIKFDVSIFKPVWDDSDFSFLSNYKERPDIFVNDLLAFFADRLKVQQREKGVRHDLIDAVFSLGGEDDLVRILARVAALQDFVATEDGANLLAGYKRAGNILKIEEKKDKASYAEAAPDPKRFAQDEERRLFEALGAAQGEAKAALEIEDFADAMRALARLRAPIDAFFDHVTVNAEDAALRKNRLALLAQIRAAADTVADFSKIEG